MLLPSLRTWRISAAGPPASHEPDVDDLLLAAQALSLNARRSRSSAGRLNLVPLPALAIMNERDAAGQTAPGARSARIVMLAQCDGQRVLFMNPALVADGEPARPTIEPLAVLAQQWSGELILIASHASLAGALARFDFSWFVPSLVKYRRSFTQVLAISLFLQLFALVGPFSSRS